MLQPFKNSHPHQVKIPLILTIFEVHGSSIRSILLHHHPFIFQDIVLEQKPRKPIKQR